MISRSRHLVNYLNSAAKSNKIGLTYDGNAARWLTRPNDGPEGGIGTWTSASNFYSSA